MEMFGGFVQVRDGKLFRGGVADIIQSLTESIHLQKTRFASDNLITWNRNLSFLRDRFFANIWENEEYPQKDRKIIWRTYILEYFARAASRLPGDFLEVGCYQGHTADIVTQRVDFAALDKRYLLFDLFAWQEGDAHRPLDHLEDPDLYDRVVRRFADNPAVRIVRGRVPDSFEGTLPERIAFAHIDLNSVAAEAGAIARIYPRLTDGAVVIFDDYGWWSLSDQKIAVDKVLEPHGAGVLELPTGQGLLIKSVPPPRC